MLIRAMGGRPVDRAGVHTPNAGVGHTMNNHPVLLYRGRLYNSAKNAGRSYIEELRERILYCCARSPA